MTDEVKVVSLKFMGADGDPLDYVMIEGENAEQAKGLATRWAEENVSQPFDRIEEHQGVISAPDEPEDDILDGVNVWHLPF